MEENSYVGITLSGVFISTTHRDNPNSSDRHRDRKSWRSSQLICRDDLVVMQFCVETLLKIDPSHANIISLQGETIHCADKTFPPPRRMEHSAMSVEQNAVSIWSDQGNDTCLQLWLLSVKVHMLLRMFVCYSHFLQTCIWGYYQLWCLTVCGGI